MIILPPDNSQVELYARGLSSRANYKKYKKVEVKKFQDINLYEHSWNDHENLYILNLEQLPICVVSNMNLETNIIAIGNDGTMVLFPNCIGEHDLFISPTKNIFNVILETIKGEQKNE